VAALACVLAKVREDTANSLDPRDSFFGRQIGRRTFEGKESAPLKPLRFKALLKAGTDEEIARGFQRAVLILRRRANVADLARTILWWDRDETRARLAFDYYGAGDASPSATRSEIEPHKDAHTEAQP
jgi:CRISPR type I-E-associated protein CasB/Cse2